MRKSSQEQWEEIAWLGKAPKTSKNIWGIRLLRWLEDDSLWIDLRKFWEVDGGLQGTRQGIRFRAESLGDFLSALSAGQELIEKGTPA